MLKSLILCNSLQFNHLTSDGYGGNVWQRRTLTGQRGAIVRGSISHKFSTLTLRLSKSRRESKRDRLPTSASIREHMRTYANIVEHPRTSSSIVGHPVSVERGRWGREGKVTTGGGRPPRARPPHLYTPLKSHTPTLNLPTLDSGGSWVGYGKA